MAPRRSPITISVDNIVYDQFQEYQKQLEGIEKVYNPNIHNSFPRNLFNIESNSFSNTKNMSPMQTSITSSNNNNLNNSNFNNNKKEQFIHCCYPNGDCLKIDDSIPMDDLSECVRVICNNENCFVGQYMHRECFESWEQSVLVTLKSVGRARSWSDRQRSQNLWTKKGYDLVYKSCVCKCSRGHLRKDMEWTPPSIKNVNNQYSNGIVNGHRITTNSVANIGSCNDDDDKKKKKKRNRNQKTALALTALNTNAYLSNSQQLEYNGLSNDGSECNNSLMGTNSVQNPNNNNSVGDNSLINSLIPNPNVGIIGSGLNHNNNQQQTLSQLQQQQNILSSLGNIIRNCKDNVLGIDLQSQNKSISPSNGSTSPTTSQCSGDTTISPKSQPLHLQTQELLQQQFQQNLLQNDISKSFFNEMGRAVNLNNSTNISLPTSILVKKESENQTLIPITPDQHPLVCTEMIPLIDKQNLVQQQKNKEVEIYSERVRSTSGCNGIFSRRLDFSSFNLLPKTRLNSYQVKIEDEGNHGNDETRLFILSSLAQSQMSRVACILCEAPMLVFDRYPLVDGSFFLSPKQHSSNCIEVKYEGRVLYLTCVCMGCLDGTSTNRVISCRFCGVAWDGSNLVLGTMYAYDIFAAMPCCAERLKCNKCFELLLHPQQRLNFYSDYSHCVTCPYCTTQDTHFVKPLSYCYTKNSTTQHQHIA